MIFQGMDSWSLKVLVPVIKNKILTFLLKWSKGVEHTHSLIFRSVFQSRATDPNSAANWSTLRTSAALLLNFVESPGNPAINIYFIRLTNTCDDNKPCCNLVCGYSRNFNKKMDTTCNMHRKTIHAYKISVWKCQGKRPHHSRWPDNI